MTLRPRPTTLLAAALGLLLGACGGSLYDAAGVPKVASSTCEAGTHLCGGGCVADTEVTACGPSCLDCSGTSVPAGSAPACVDVAGAWGCGFACTAPARQCGAQCLPESVDACGPTCQVCPAGPAGSTRSCDLVAGGGGARQCSFSCTAPTRICAALNACRNDDVNACGPTCQVCPAPAGATPTCTAGAGGVNACGFQCAPGFFAVGGACQRAIAVAAGGSHACALTKGGGLTCWGANGAGQLGVAGAGGPSPREVFASGVTAVAAGANHTCAVHQGQVKCWGSNVAGQLGNGTAGTGGPAPQLVTLSGAVELAAGASHTCARLAGGAVFCWGSNAAGQLGTGNLLTHPAPFASLVTAGADQVAAFGDTTCAIAGTALKCWGANGAGQTGKGATSGAEPTPITVPLPGAPLLATVGGSHACASVAALGLYCWGSDAELQLGTRTPPVNSLVPSQADRIDNNRDSGVLAAGAGHTCTGRAAAAEVGLSCSGRSDQGQTGLFSPTPLAEATVALAGHPISAAAGLDFTCSLIDTSAPNLVLVVQCWGSNSSGQLGRALAGGATFDQTPGLVGP